MGTTRSFSTMLNEYLPNELFAEELVQRDYILNKIDVDKNWLGGDVIVPFRAAEASSVAFGALTASTDVSETLPVRGKITGYVELWGTLSFQHTDIMQHGAISEQNLLKMLPDMVERFMDYMKQVVSINLGTGASFAKVTDATSAASGIMSVDHVDRFQIGQKVSLVDGDTAVASYYVIAINVNAGSGTDVTGTVTLSATRGGSAADVSAYSVAQLAKFYHPGGDTSSFNSMRAILLSSANGGATTVHGQTKTAYPILQAVNYDGSGINASNILEKLFDAYTAVRVRAKGKADTFLMSYKNLGSVMKAVETQKGAFKVTVNSTNASLFGWTEIKITSVKGELTIVGIQEMDSDIIPIIDWSVWTFRSNGLFKKRTSPDGREYFEVRATTGVSYLVDIACFGELECRAPGQNGIIYGISY
jgi:hypothetical protein